MKKYKLFVGIDVSKLKLDVNLVYSTESKSSKHFIIANTPKGLQELLNHLKN